METADFKMKIRKFLKGNGDNTQNRLLSAILIIIVVAMCFATDRFYRPTNLLNILVQVTALGIAALGAGMVMMSGGFDLTIGNVISFAGCSAAFVMSMGANAQVGFLTGVAVATACGFINGVLVVVTKAEPFIITLGMMTIYQGITLLVTRGKNIKVEAAGFTFGRDKIGGVFPITILALILVYIIIGLILKFTKFGRRVYSIGDNEEASYLSGIKIKRNKILIYTLNGFLLGIAAMFLLSRLGSCNSTMGDSILMQAIAAAVIGGVSMAGGKGSAIGVFFGTLLIGIISNSLNLLQVPSFWQYVILGSIIVVAVYVSNIGKKSR